MKKKTSHRAGSRLYLSMALLTLGLFIILIYALTLPFNRMQSNIVLSATAWASILLMLIDLVEILAYATGASLLLFAAFRPFSSATVLRLGGIYALTTLLRYILDLSGAWILYGTRHFVYNILEPTLLNQLPYLLLDLLFVLAATVLALCFAERYYQKRSVITKVSVLLSNEDSPLPAISLHPFKKIISLKNPLQLCVFLLGCILAAANVISNLLFDLQYLSLGITVTASDVFSMIGSYLYSILLGLIFYIVCVLVLNLLFRHQDKLTKS